MTSLEPTGAGKTRTKNMVLRLDQDLADLLATVAEVEGRSVSDVAREAIAALVEARRKDKRFRRQLEDNLARHQRLLDLLLRPGLGRYDRHHRQVRHVILAFAAGHLAMAGTAYSDGNRVPDLQPRQRLYG